METNDENGMKIEWAMWRRVLFLNAPGSSSSSSFIYFFFWREAFNLVFSSPFLKMRLDKAARVKSTVIEDHVLWGRNA